MPCIVAEPQGMLKYVDSKFENHLYARASMEARMACGMGACYACVVQPLAESCTPKIFVFVKKGQFSLLKKSSSREVLPCQRLNQKIV